MSSFLRKEGQCMCRNKLVFECLIVVSRGNKIDVLTNVKIKQC